MHLKPFAMSAVICALPWVPCQAQAPLKLEPLTESEALSGCGTCFYLKGDAENPPQVFADGGGDAIVRVNGQPHTLIRKSRRETTGPRKGSELGSRVHEVWSDGRVEVVLDYVVVGLGEENLHLRGTIMVSSGKSVQTVHVEGDSGC